MKWEDLLEKKIDSKDLNWVGFLTEAFLYIPPKLRKEIFEFISLIRIEPLDSSFFAYYNYDNNVLFINSKKFRKIDQKFLFIFFHEIGHIIDHLSKFNLSDSFYMKFNKNQALFDDENDKKDKKEMFADYFGLWMLNIGKTKFFSPLRIKNGQISDNGWVISADMTKEAAFMKKWFFPTKNCLLIKGKREN